MEDNNKRKIKVALKQLQDNLAKADLLYGSKRHSGDMLEIKVFQKSQLIFRVKPDHHNRPHFHIDCGKERHSASVCIKTSELLAGKLPSKYVKVVNSWVEENREDLLQLWNELKQGIDPKELRMKFDGGTY